MAMTFGEWRRERHGRGTRAEYETYLREWHEFTDRANEPHTAPGSPVVVTLAPGHGGEKNLNQACNLIRDITGKDPAAYTDETGATVVYASPAPAYPQ